jgi:hypothetical protein
VSRFKKRKQGSKNKMNSTVSFALSYSLDSNLNLVEALRYELEQRGFHVWNNASDDTTPTSQTVLEFPKKQLERPAPWVIVFLSDHYAEDERCLSELSHANKENRIFCFMRFRPDFNPHDFTGLKEDIDQDCFMFDLSNTEVVRNVVNGIVWKIR